MKPVIQNTPKFFQIITRILILGMVGLHLASASDNFKLKSLGLALGAWESEVTTGATKTKEKYYSLPKISAGFSLYRFKGSVSTSLENSQKGDSSDTGVNNISFILGRDFPLGSFRANVQLGSIVPTRSPNSKRNDPFIGSGNIFVQSGLGLGGSPFPFYKRLKLATGVFAKVAVTETYLDAIAGVGSFDGYTYVALSHPIYKKVKLSVESMYFYQDYSWIVDDVYEIKQSYALGAGINIPLLKKYSVGIKGGTSLWSHSSISRSGFEIFTEERDSFFYSLSLHRRF